MYNRYMRVLVFFDLPTVSATDRKNYSDFRKFLIKQGFIMIQFSVYMKITRNHDDAKKYIIRIKRNTPPKGSIRVLNITDKQYSNMYILLGDHLGVDEETPENEIIMI